MAISIAATQSLLGGLKSRHRQSLPSNTRIILHQYRISRRQNHQLDPVLRRDMRHVSVGAGETNGQEPEQDDDSTRTVDDDTVSTAIDASTTNTASEEEEEEEAVLSTEEIQRQMGALRAAAAAASQDEASKDASLVDGVLEEVRLIEWPSFTSALLNTVLVIALVLGTSVVLFGVNTSLSEISRQIYSSSGGASSG